MMWFSRLSGLLLFPIHSWFCVCVYAREKKREPGLLNIVHNILSIIFAIFSPLCTEMCITAYALGRKYQVIVRLIGLCRIVGPQF